VDTADELSVRLQCQLLGLDRSGLYYAPVMPDAEEVRICHRLDQLYTDHPFYGVRKMTLLLRQEGWSINPKRVRRLLRTLGLVAIYPGPRRSANLSAPGAGGQKFPYLLRELAIVRPHQVWAVDITYVRLQGGFAYLVAILEWFSRFVLAWELAPSLEVLYCLRALHRALDSAGQAAEIMNSDQGSQFTSEDWIAAVQNAGMQVSHDGRGRALDNVMIERLWRTVKYEDNYLRDYADVREARVGLERYFAFYNHERPHQALQYRTPAQILLEGSLPTEP
jgi:putative transposase